MKFRGELKVAITEIMRQPKNDSPVYEFLKQLRPPKLEELLVAASAGGNIVPPVPAPANDQTVSVLMSQVDGAFKQSNFVIAKSLLQVVRGMLPADAYVVQKLALATYKSKVPTAVPRWRRRAASCANSIPEAPTMPRPLDYGVRFTNGCGKRRSNRHTSTSRSSLTRKASTSRTTTTTASISPFC